MTENTRYFRIEGDRSSQRKVFGKMADYRPGITVDIGADFEHANPSCASIGIQTDNGKMVALTEDQWAELVAKVAAGVATIHGLKR